MSSFWDWWAESLFVSIIVANYSGAPAGAEGARGRSSIPIENGKSMKPRKFGGRPRPYVRMYARIRPGTSLSLSLIWSPSYAKSNTKTFFGLLRVNLNVIETCKNTLLFQRFFFSHVFS